MVSSPETHPAWRLDWLTPARCRLILTAVLLLGFVGHLVYLTGDCPIDLSGDEAHYWDWSRQLDLSYYSKGPLVAYLIRASCALFGDTMWAVRLPAVVLATGTALVTYLLTRKLFGSERLALGAVLLGALVPIFIAGSVLMTIDSPFFFCWALATYLAAHAIFDEKRSLWPLIGIVVGIGFLAKYAMLLWLPSMILALSADRSPRRLVGTPGPWIATAIALLFTAPVIVWNQRHGWVSLHHVARQTGTDAVSRFTPLNFLEFIGGQIGVIGPPLAVLIVGACVYGWSRDKLHGREMRFLLSVGLPLLILTALTSFRTKVQPNWPAPAYFTLLILTAHFISTRLLEPVRWRPWRPWVYATIALGLIAMPVLHHSEMLYPLLRFQQGVPSARKFDPTARLKGWREQAELIARELEKLPANAFVLCDDYQTTAEMAFYLPDQPKTCYAGSYFTGARRKRYTQYDLWPDRSLDPARRPEMLGRDAIYVGYVNDDIRAAFDRVDGPHLIDIISRGVKIRTVRYARCYGFKGMKLPGAPANF